MQVTSQRRTLTRVSMVALWAAAGMLAAAAPSAATPLCTADATTLCIDQTAGDGRWEIKLDWATSLNGGSSGHAHAVPLDSVGISRGGLFWFFSADNPELIVKVIDGCGYNNHAWVYYSATTNVGFTLTVTDKLYPTHVWTSTNADLHTADPAADILAFTCDGSDPEPNPTGPWILTTRPGPFFTPTAEHPIERIDIPVAANEEFYKIVVEVEVDLDGYYAAEPGGKHNLFTLWRGDDDLRGDLVGELGLYGPDVMELEGVSSLDLPNNQREYRSIFHDLDPQGVYSFLYVYDLSNNRIKTYVYEGSVVGENRLYLMTGDTTAQYPIRPEDGGFTITFGSTLGGSIGANGVPTYGWEYRNLKVYLERTTD
jgi:hypothetical protein